MVAAVGTEWRFSPGIVAAIEGLDGPNGADLTLSAKLVRPVIAALHDWAGWTNGGARYLQVFAASHRGIQGSWKTLPEDRIAKIEQGVRDSKITQLHLEVKSNSDRTQRGDFVVTIAFTLGERQESETSPHQLVIRRPRVSLEVIRANESTRRSHGLDDLALVCALFDAVVSVVPPANGFPTFDNTGGGSRSPLDRHIAPGERTTGGYPPDKALGYDWVELFTPAMIDQLRDHGRDLATIPAELVRHVDFGELHRCVLASPSRSPYDVTDDDMRRFRDFISPVLMSHGPPQVGSWGHEHWLINRMSRPRNVLPDDWFQTDDR